MRTLPLTKGLVAVVDDADYEKAAAFKWTALTPKSGKRYAYRRSPRPEQRAIYLHRFIIDAPEGTEVDHRDGDGLNCQRYNLRVCSHQSNSQNVKKRSDNSSGFKGVFLHRELSKWCCQIQGKHIGLFDTAEEAARAYEGEAVALYGEFANLNFEPTAAQGAQPNAS